MLLTHIEQVHRAGLVDLLSRTAEFTPEETAVALELIDDGLAKRGDYRFYVDAEGARVRGYICFGPAPMTEGTFDLYWICVDSSLKKSGIGRALVRKMEEELRGSRGRLVRVETEGTPAYEATRAFYVALGYEVLATIRGFYAEGRDLVIFGRYLV